MWLSVSSLGRVKCMPCTHRVRDNSVLAVILSQSFFASSCRDVILLCVQRALLSRALLRLSWLDTCAYVACALLFEPLVFLETHIANTRVGIR